MSANICFYTDVACTKEVPISGSFYDLVVGPITGLDGDTGDRVDLRLYAKNIGDQDAMETYIVKEGDLPNMLTLGNVEGNYDPSKLKLGTIKPGVVRDFLIKIVVPAGTDKCIIEPKLFAKYKSLP